MAISPDPKKNQLIAALPDAEWQRWLPQLEFVDMPLGQGAGSFQCASCPGTGAGELIGTQAADRRARQLASIPSNNWQQK